MPLVRSPFSTAVRLTARWVHDRADAWAVASQQRSRRNAMVASTRLAQRRIEAEDVSDYLVDRAVGGDDPRAATPDGVAHG